MKCEFKIKFYPERTRTGLRVLAKKLRHGSYFWMSNDAGDKGDQGIMGINGGSMGGSKGEGRFNAHEPAPSLALPCLSLTFLYKYNINTYAKRTKSSIYIRTY